MPPALFSHLRIALVILGYLWLHINFKIVFSSSVKNVVGDLIGITLNLYIALGSMAILTILIFPIQEHEVFSNSLSHFQFPLSAFYSSQHIILSIPCHVYYYFVTFDTIFKGIFFFFFLLSHLDISF